MQSKSRSIASILMSILILSATAVALLSSTKPYPTVISFVVTAGSHDLSLSTANGFNLAQSDTYGVGGGNETFGFSTRVVESSGVSVPLPTWEATPVTTDWLYTLVAFA